MTMLNRSTWNGTKKKKTNPIESDQDIDISKDYKQKLY